MKYFWIPVLFVSASLGFAQTWTNRTYDQALNDPKKTVVDYFLLCPEILLDNDGRLDIFPLFRSDPASFEPKKNLLHRGYSARAFSVDSVVIDIANAYLSISGVFTSKRYQLIFVYFDRQGKSDVPAYSYYEERGEKDIHRCSLYELASADEWTDITDKLLPRLRLSDLDTGPRKPADEYPDVDWEYVLPQKGTTVLAIPHMTEKMADSGFKGSAFQMVQAFSNRSIELLWDRKQGEFTKGAVQ
ncbi:MAG: hypothetical protein ABSG21_12950 [Spirochaetia bacterium]